MHVTVSVSECGTVLFLDLLLKKPAEFIWDSDVESEASRHLT